MNRDAQPVEGERRRQWQQAASLAGRVIEHQRADWSKKNSENAIRLLFADALQKTGGLQEAAVQLRELVKRNPDVAVAHYRLGRIYLRTGKLKEAEASFREAIRYTSNHADAASHNALGVVLEKQGKSDEAREAFERVLEIQPHHKQAAERLQQLSPQREAAP